MRIAVGRIDALRDRAKRADRCEQVGARTGKIQRRNRVVLLKCDVSLVVRGDRKLRLNIEVSVGRSDVGHVDPHGVEGYARRQSGLEVHGDNIGRDDQKTVRRDHTTQVDHTHRTRRLGLIRGELPFVRHHSPPPIWGELDGIRVKTDLNRAKNGARHQIEERHPPENPCIVGRDDRGHTEAAAAGVRRHTAHGQRRRGTEDSIELSRNRIGELTRRTESVDVDFVGRCASTSQRVRHQNKVRTRRRVIVSNHLSPSGNRDAGNQGNLTSDRQSQGE